MSCLVKNQLNYEHFGENRVIATHDCKVMYGASNSTHFFLEQPVNINEHRIMEYKCSAVAEMGDSLATIDMARQEGGCSAPFVGGAQHNVAWAEVNLRTKWHLDPSSHFATTDMGRKLRAVPLWGRGAGSPTNTIWPGPRPTCLPSFILIRPAV